MASFSLTQFRRVLPGAAVSVSALILPVHSHAQDYLSTTIRIVFPSVPGGLNDAVAMFPASQFGKAVGQSAIVVHRAGAGGAVGTQFVAKAPPDGDTLLLGDIGPLVFLPAVTPNAPYITKRDLTAVGSL